MKNNELKNNFILQSLDEIMSDRYGRYAKYIIQQRALPDARDGLKPVQRRILFSMYELGLINEKPFKKSARVVGDVIGKYHPHGDSSIYEAMVRMAQDWKMNIPLVEMHGNKGSVDDDPAAAMRYTEARLSKISNLLIENIKKNTVSFIPNFDDSEIEPTVLPAFFPNLLVNGAKGIAAGFATEIPPHNLEEVIEGVIAKIKNPNIKIEKLNEIIIGPDFPTGGVIHGIEGIKEAFLTGKGRITITSKYEIKNSKIIITEIPYGVIKSKLVRQIDEINLDKNISGMIEVRDETNREGIKIVIDLEKNSEPNKIIKFLMQKTELQIYYSYNNIAIYNKAPVLMNIHDMIKAFLEHLIVIQKNRIQFDLTKFLKRLEIINGYIKLNSISNEIIEMIKTSENSKQGVIKNLVDIFLFTQLQAEAISNLRLYRLSKADIKEFLEEKIELAKKINFLQNLLNDQKSFDKELIKILREIKKTYGISRRTLIKHESLKLNVSLSDLIQSEETYVGISKHGYIKRFNSKVYESNDIQNYLLKDEDSIIFLNKVLTTNKLLIFTNKGNFLNVPIFKITEDKWKNLGMHLNDLVTINSDEVIVKVIYVEDFSKNLSIVLLSKKGYAKKINLSEFNISRDNKIYRSFKFKKEKDELLDAFLSNDKLNILMIDEKQILHNFSENEIKTLGIKTAGLKLVDTIKNKAFITSAVAYKNNDTLFFVSEKGYAKKVSFQKRIQLMANARKNYLTKVIKIKPQKIIKILNFVNDINLAVKTINNTVIINTNELRDTESLVNLNTKNILGVISLAKLTNLQEITSIFNLTKLEKNDDFTTNSKDTNEDDLNFSKAQKSVDNISLFDIDEIIKKIKK